MGTCRKNALSDPISCKDEGLTKIFFFIAPWTEKKDRISYISMFLWVLEVIFIVQTHKRRKHV